MCNQRGACDNSSTRAATVARVFFFPVQVLPDEQESANDCEDSKKDFASGSRHVDRTFIL